MGTATPASDGMRRKFTIALPKWGRTPFLRIVGGVTQGVMTRRGLVVCGWLGVAAAITGVASGIAMLVWPEHSARGLLRYPFTPHEFRAMQSWFGIHHLAMVAVLAAFAASSAMGVSRIGRTAAWFSVLGTALLAANELHAIAYDEWTLRDANRGLLGAGYGISTNVCGLGALIAGISVIRQHRWTGWHRWVPLAIGIVHFVIVTPVLFSESYVGARIAIVTWISLFGLLGRALIVETRRTTN